MNTNSPDDDMANEYDFTVGERGRLAKRLEIGYDIVIDGDEDHAVRVPPSEVRGSQARLDNRRNKAAHKRA
jgi:hypothetical protein